MPVDAVSAVTHSCLNCIEYSLGKMHGPYGGAWVGKLRVAIEVLSRIVLRHDPAQVDATLKSALTHYSNRDIAGHPWLTRPLRNLLKRCWEALPERFRIDRVLLLLSAPIVGLDGFDTSPGGHQHVDTGEILLDQELSLPARTPENEEHWRDAVALMIRGLRHGGEARRRASIRVGLPDLSDRFTDAERSQIAAALWHSDYTGTDGLPQDTDLHDWAFLELPEPSAGLAEQRFRRKWFDKSALARVTRPESSGTYRISLGPVTPGPTDLNGVIGQVGIALAQVSRRDCSLMLSEEDAELLGQYIDEWCDLEIPPTVPGMEASMSELTRYGLIGLRSILRMIQVTDSTAAKLYDKLIKLNKSRIPAFELVGSLVKMLPERRGDLVMLMRMGLVTDDVDFAANAAVGLFRWLQETTNSASSDLSPPDDLTREIGVTIATRRRGMLDQALQIAEWIFSEGRQSQKDAIRMPVIQGLSYLLDELRYDRRFENSGDDVDVPRVRSRCAELTVTLSRVGVEDPVVTRWIEAIRDDPLPEVRYTDPVNGGARTIDQAQDCPDGSAADQ